MKCPSCAGRKLVRDTRDIPYTYKGKTTTIPAVRGDFCPACGESVLAAAEASRVSAGRCWSSISTSTPLLSTLASLRVRKKLALDQREAAAIFGGGPNAFSRYENGKTKPPLALVKLLMVLDGTPTC
jgi:HTH-type transcriptional regulator/antitoxin MqsA